MAVAEDFLRHSYYSLDVLRRSPPKRLRAGWKLVFVQVAGIDGYRHSLTFGDNCSLWCAASVPCHGTYRTSHPAPDFKPAPTVVAAVDGSPLSAVHLDARSRRVRPRRGTRSTRPRPAAAPLARDQRN